MGAHNKSCKLGSLEICWYDRVAVVGIGLGLGSGAVAIDNPWGLLLWSRPQWMIANLRFLLFLLCKGNVQL